MLKSSGQVAQKCKSKDMYPKTFFVYCLNFSRKGILFQQQNIYVCVCQQFSHCQTIEIFLCTNSKMTKEHMYILVCLCVYVCVYHSIIYEFQDEDVGNIIHYYCELKQFCRNLWQNVLTSLEDHLCFSPFQEFTLKHKVHYIKSQIYVETLIKII